MRDLQACDGISPPGEPGWISAHGVVHEAAGKASSWNGQMSPTLRSNGELSTLMFLFCLSYGKKMYSPASRNLSAISMNSGRLSPAERKNSPRDRTPDSSLRETQARTWNGVPAAVSLSLSTPAQTTPRAE